MSSENDFGNSALKDALNNRMSKIIIIHQGDPEASEKPDPNTGAAMQREVERDDIRKQVPNGNKLYNGIRREDGAPESVQRDFEYQGVIRKPKPKDPKPEEEESD